MLILLPPARKGVSPRHIDLKVEDASDDDPSVWGHYAEGLGTAYDELAALATSYSEDEFLRGIEAYERNCLAWVEFVAADDRVRRADVWKIAEAIGLRFTAGQSRSAVLAAMTARIEALARQRRDAWRDDQTFRAEAASP